MPEGEKLIAAQSLAASCEGALNKLAPYDPSAPVRPAAVLRDTFAGPVFWLLLGLALLVPDSTRGWGVIIIVIAALVTLVQVRSLKVGGDTLGQHSAPMFCPHRVAFGKWGRRCSSCVQEVLVERGRLHRNLILAQEELKALQRAHDYYVERRRREWETEQEQRRQADRDRAKTEGGLRSMHPTKFEELVAELFAKMGWSTTVTQASGDDGIDVIARKPTGTLVIQCKRYGESTKVGRPEVQQLYGAMAHAGADSCAFVTTSSFTQQAVDAAKKLRVDLIDMPKLRELLRAHGLG